MTIKVFLSHQKSDAVLAAQIADHLRAYHGIDSYLDVIDIHISKNGQDLSDHIRYEMSKCTQLLAVISYETRNSQWVPWEIGVAAEKEFPLATFVKMQSSPPEFLKKWPVLETMAHLDAYAIASQTAARTVLLESTYTTASTAKTKGLKAFYRSLNAALPPSGFVY
jgi:hypothetical protein